MDTRLHALRLDKCLADMHRTLKDFTFEIEKGDFSQTIIATICQFLTCSPQYNLENLEISLSFSLYRPDEIRKDYTEWTKLANVLLDRVRFPCLQFVNLKVTLHLHGRLTFETHGDAKFNAFLKEPLRDLFSSTDFEFTAHVDIRRPFS